MKLVYKKPADAKVEEGILKESVRNQTVFYILHQGM